MSDEVRIETADRVRTIAIHRPAVKNALTRDTVRTLTDAFRDVSADRSVRAVLLAGRGGAFSSGADLQAAMADPGGTPVENVELFHDLTRAVVECPRPVVALVDGPAVGFGCSLALACDMRVATDRAYLQLKFVRIGLVPDGGGTFWLPRLVGLGRTAEMIMLGEPVYAQTAFAWGMVNRVEPVERAEGVALGLARRLADGPPATLRRMRRLLYDNAEGDVYAALDRERDAQVQCLASPDMLEGVTAFFERREPRFQDDG